MSLVNTCHANRRAGLLKVDYHERPSIPSLQTWTLVYIRTLFRACYRHQQAAAAATAAVMRFPQPPRGAALRVVGSCCPCFPSPRTLWILLCKSGAIGISEMSLVPRNPMVYFIPVQSFCEMLKIVSCEYDRVNGWNSTLQAAWYIRRVRIIWFCELNLRYD